MSITDKFFQLLFSSDSPNGLELGWMDTKHDIIDLLQECTANGDVAEPQEANSASPIAEESMPVINLSEPVTWPSSEDTPDLVGADNTPVDTDIDNDLLCEAFKLLDKAGVSVDDLVQFGSFLDGTEDGQSDASVAGSELNQSGVVIADDDTGPSDSGLESLVSSCPGSPLDAAEFSPLYEPPTLDQPRTKSKRGRRMAPYSKLPADRKERKKIQNKTAALKYRQKKKEETKKVFTEVELLEIKNKELKNKVESISKEISYLKQLMSDVLKAKS